VKGTRYGALRTSIRKRIDIIHCSKCLACSWFSCLMLSQNALICLQQERKRNDHALTSLCGVLGDKPVNRSIDISGESQTHSVTLLASISGPDRDVALWHFRPYPSYDSFWAILHRYSASYCRKELRKNVSDCKVRQLQLQIKKRAIGYRQRRVGSSDAPWRRMGEWSYSSTSS